MKTFLLKDKKPLCKWGSLKDESYFSGTIPKDYDLAINPSKNIIVIDIDVDIEKNVNGFNNISEDILKELEETFNYSTKRGGKHYWLYYTGKEYLVNRSTEYNIDLRTNKGYARYNYHIDIRECLHLIKNTSHNINIWIENLFSINKTNLCK